MFLSFPFVFINLTLFFDFNWIITYCFQLTDRNHLSSPTNHPDRLDHAPTTIQESSHAGASERSTQPHARPFRPSPRLLHAEIPRIPNHRSASTTHATDTGPSTRLPWGSEEREKLINHIEPIPGPRSHNASLATSNIKPDSENPPTNISSSHVSFSHKKSKESPHILPTIPSPIPRLHHAGTTDRPSIIYPGLSGVILRAPNLYHDARSSNHEPYNMLDHNISVSMNPDRPDRPSTRANETLNPPPTVYILTYPAYPYDSARSIRSVGCWPLSILLLSLTFSFCFISSIATALSYNSWSIASYPFSFSFSPFFYSAILYSFSPPPFPPFYFYLLSIFMVSVLVKSYEMKWWAYADHCLHCYVL